MGGNKMGGGHNFWLKVSGGSLGGNYDILNESNPNFLVEFSYECS